MVVLIEKTAEYELRFKIKMDFLEENNIEFKNVSKILNEIDDEYLMLDAYLQGVWIPKSMIEPEKVIFGENLETDADIPKELE